MYLTCGIRSDISFIIKQLSRYNSDLQIINIYTAKSILQYLKGTISFGLIYGRDIAYFMEL